MPTYSYKCSKCGDQRDYMRRISQATPQIETPCPNCKAEHSLEKQLSAPSFQLKGTGWYQTDFK